MKISARGKYGTRALLELALRWGKEPATLKNIALSQEIPLHYLEHLIAPLVSAGIIRSNRGARGGNQVAETDSPAPNSPRSVVHRAPGVVKPGAPRRASVRVTRT